MLSVKRPTPTTVLYTTSTRSPPATWTACASQYGLLAARLLASIFIAALLTSEYCNTSATYTLGTGILDAFQAGAMNTLFGALAAWVKQHLPWYYRLILVTGTTWLIFTRSHTEESLLVIRGLGVQTATSGPLYLWTSSTRFIPTSSIQDIFIHEAFKGFEVRYYLSIVVEGEEGIVVVFPSILPRREVLEQVWRGTRACLYEPKG